MSQKSYYFWQQRPNIHEAALICGLQSLGHKVTVIYSDSVSPVHAQLGVGLPFYGDATILMDPIEALTQLSVSSTSSDVVVHVLTGVRAFPLTRLAFSHLKRDHAPIVYLAESRDNRGILGMLRRIETFLFDCQINSRIDALFAVGDMATSWYSKSIIRPKCIFRFGWFVLECPPVKQEYPPLSNLLASPPEVNLASPFSIVFAGQLEHRKGVDVLIRALALLDLANIELKIIGTGSQSSNLQDLSKKLLPDRVRFMGPLPNELVRLELENADLVVLPSRFDGWGAVVVEALLSGTPAICSNQCGVSSLASLSGLLNVFRSGSSLDLSNQVRRQVSLGKMSPHRRSAHKVLANTGIGSNAISRYFDNCIDFVINRRNASSSDRILPLPPWILAERK